MDVCVNSVDTIALERDPWTVPESYEFGHGKVVPMWAGQKCDWKIVE